MPRYGNVTGEVRERKKGRAYSIRVRLEPDVTHNHWHWSPWRKVEGNKAHAVAMLEAYAQELSDDKTGRNATVDEYIEVWAAKREALGKVSPLTIKRDKTELARIGKYLGKARLRDLTAERIEKAYVQARSNEQLSTSSLHKMHAKLSQILKRALADGYISTNPCDAIDGLTRPKVDPDKRKIKRITEAELIQLQHELRQSSKTGKTMAVWLALATGMRRGEVLALTWGDVDLRGSKLSVRRQYGKEHQLKDTKTPKSRRTIALDSVTVKMLREWALQQKHELGAKGTPVTRETPVCSNRDGAYLEPDTFSRWRRKFYVDHGLGYYENPESRTGYVGPDFHALRHAQASLLVAEGVDPKTVQERLGHERISTTLEIYAEAEREKDVEAANKIGDLFESRKTTD